MRNGCMEGCCFISIPGEEAICVKNHATYVLLLLLAPCLLVGTMGLTKKAAAIRPACSSLTPHKRDFGQLSDAADDFDGFPQLLRAAVQHLKEQCIDSLIFYRGGLKYASQVL